MVDALRKGSHSAAYILFNLFNQMFFFFKKKSLKIKYNYKKNKPTKLFSHVHCAKTEKQNILVLRAV